jgi:hypothetical protein
MEKSISEKLTQYLGIAAGITAGVSSQAQVLYQDFGPNGITIDKDTLFPINLNQDTINDFAFRTRFDFQIGIATFDEISILPLFSTANRIAGDTPLNYAYAFKLDFNTDIDANLDWLGALEEGSLSFARNGQFIYNDYWNGGVQDQFLGLRIRINDSLHYGWARLDVAADGKSFTLKDHALNLKPEQPLNTSYLIGVDEHESMAFIVNQRPGEIWIKADILQQNARVELFDLNGRIIHQGEIRPQDIHTISTQNCRAGMYVLRMYNSDGLREKKVIVR